MDSKMKEKLLLFSAIFHDIGKVVSGSMTRGIRSSIDWSSVRNFRDDVFASGSEKHHEVVGMWIIYNLVRNGTILPPYGTKNLFLYIRHHTSHRHGLELKKDFVSQEIKEISSMVKEADSIASGERHEEIGVSDFDTREMVNPFMTIGSDVLEAVESIQKIRPVTLGEFLDVDDLSEVFHYGDLDIDPYHVIMEMENAEKKIDFSLPLFEFGDVLDSFMKFYTSFVPDARPYGSGGILRIPDSSLYSHLKLTAAIAHAKYLSPNSEKAMIVSGDFSGIQRFISDVPNRRAAKLLKVKSMLVRLLEVGIARKICRMFGVTPINIFLSSGGKFHVLVPYDIEKFREAKEKIEMGVYDYFGGTLSIVLSSSEVSWKELGMNRMENGMSIMGFVESSLANEKLKKFRNISTIIEKDVVFQDEMKCIFCQSTGHEIDDEIYVCDKHEGLYKGILLHGTLRELKSKSVSFNRGENIGGVVYIGIGDIGEVKLSVGKRYKGPFIYIPSVFPVKRNEGKESIIEMEELAENLGKGKKLFFAKGDVDDLGFHLSKIGGIIKGHDGGDYERKSLSKLLTVSQLIEHIFSGWLSRVIEKENDNGKVYLLFSGGDDFTFFGDRSVVRVLSKLSSNFSHITPRSISFSSTLMLFNPHKRFRDMYGDAERALKHSKSVSPMIFGTETKNAFALNSDDLVLVNMPEILEMLEMFCGVRKEVDGKLNPLLQLTQSKKYAISSLMSSFAEKIRSIMEGDGSIDVETWRIYRIPYVLRDAKDRGYISDMLVEMVSNAYGSAINGKREDAALEYSKIVALSFGLMIHGRLSNVEEVYA